MNDDDRRQPDPMEDYLRGGSQLSQRYAALEEDARPSAATEAAIVAAARQAVARPTASPLLVPASIAATLLLCATVVLHRPSSPPAPTPAATAADSGVAPGDARIFAAPVSPVEAGDGARLSPERWMDYIATLRERGLHDEADRELARLHAAWPDYPINP